MSSITNPPGKIVLSSSTKVSLHDRFTKLAKAKPVVTMARQELGLAKSETKLNIATRGASAKNRKLALQMAGRPSVQAALKAKQKTLKQRLGNGIDASRLSIGNKNNSVKQGFQQNQRVRPAFLNNRTNTAPSPANRFKAQNGNNNNKTQINRVGPRGGMGLKNRIKFLKSNNLKQNIQKTGFQKKFVKKNNFQKKAPAQAAASPVGKNKESLDMDLDKYMAKSKSALDNDLDSYMAQAN